MDRPPTLPKISSLPVILVVDCSRQAQSIAALVHGFRTHRPHLDLPAVILNRVAGARHADILRRALEPSGVTILGAVPRDPDLALPSRHLGLVQASEHADLASFLDRAVSSVGAHVDTDRASGVRQTGRGRDRLDRFCRRSDSA